MHRNLGLGYIQRVSERLFFVIFLIQFRLVPNKWINKSNTS